MLFLIIITSIMKHFGSTCEYNEQRDRNLFLTFRSVILASQNIRFADISRIVVNLPAERFWVSEKRAAIVISDMLKGRDTLACMCPSKREMYTVIFSRVRDILEEQPQMNLSEAVARVVSAPAPKFFLTPQSARIIYYRIRDRWFLPHLQQARRKAMLASNCRDNRNNLHD